MNYNKALKTPKDGWKHAENENMLAVVSQHIGRAHCMNPETIYNWAQKYNITYKKLGKLRDIKYNPQFMSDVLNDTFTHTKPIINGKT